MLEEQILRLFRGRIRSVLEAQDLDYEKIQEIRVRVNRPIIIRQNEREILINELVSGKEVKAIVDVLCGYSGYAYEEEIRRGYVTIEGGHRVGIVGRTVLTREGVQTIKHISALNIRIAHPMNGCAEKWKKFFYKENKPCHILIISPPGCGKTTLLRDVIRMMSNGSEQYVGATVGVVDERSEIAGTYRGTATHDLGMRTDVLDGCPKNIGMEMILRSMTPQVLAVDEIGVSDVEALENALRCGCKILATLHGETIEDYLEKPGFQALVKEKVFERYVFLRCDQMPGMLKVIYDKNLQKIWEEKMCT